MFSLSGDIHEVRTQVVGGEVGQKCTITSNFPIQLAYEGMCVGGGGSIFERTYFLNGP